MRPAWQEFSGYEKFKDVVYSGYVFMTDDNKEHLGGSVVYKTDGMRHKMMTKLAGAMVFESVKGRVIVSRSGEEARRCSMPVIEGIKFAAQIWFKEADLEGGGSPTLTEGEQAVELGWDGSVLTSANL